jgi:hypothetical protein
MKLEIKIVKDSYVLELLDDKTFISRWEEIADQNEKVTVIQEPPFVTTWYRQYLNKYQPILILGFDENSILIGIMPLAFSLKDHYLTHAGDWQAEYHGWLCTKNTDPEFIVQALIAVKKNFQLRKWQWRPIPPRSQINWLSSKDLKKEKVYVRMAEEDSPILDLNDENKINKIRKNKSLQIKLNRYKKKNSFYLERIKSKETAKNIFDILSVQCDFRQMASHQTAPFAQDKNKKQFYVERLNFPENNHFTILWSDNNPIAFHFGACDSDTVYLGLSSYNPIEEKNSPGSILIIKLIEFLKDEGYKYFDLTPGGTKYKEKYGSFHQKIYTPTIYFFRKDKIISDLKYLIHNTLKNLIISVGGQPKIVKNKFDNTLAMLKKISRLTPLKIIGKLFYERNVYILFRFLIDDISMKNLLYYENLNINTYSDLLLYNNSNIYIEKRSDLFAAALRHFSSGDLLYTKVSDGVLIQYGWMTKGRGNYRFTDFDAEFDFPDDSYLLNDFFTVPYLSMQDLFAMTLGTMLIDCRKNGAKEAFIGVNQNDLSSRSIIEKVGFKVYRKFQRTRYFWIVRKKVYS